jgi:aspartyl/asparaginyl beta-hydroxylase (cupin superfamily)
MFSSLKPGTHISAHRGSSNLRLRCHLSLENRNGQLAFIRVGNRAAYWDEGCCIAFDDSYEHEVFHRGNHERVILAFDLWHPAVSHEEIALLSQPVLRTFGRVPSHTKSTA